MNKLPMLAVDLVERLDKEFPHRHPTMDMSDRKVWYKAGQRSVVDYLLRILGEQEEDLLNDKGD